MGRREVAAGRELFFRDAHETGSLRYRLRRQRFQLVLALIDSISRQGRTTRILDLGGKPAYWSIVAKELEQRDVHISLLNRELPADVLSDRYTALRGDACAVEAEDLSYDLVHSNSVIEHVGSWSRQEEMAREVRRLAPAYFVQTPNMWFPYEPHFRSVGFHWLPEQARARMLMRRGYGYHSRQETLSGALRVLEHVRLLDGMQVRALFPDAEIRRERVFGLTKSLMAIRSAT